MPRVQSDLLAYKLLWEAAVASLALLLTKQLIYTSSLAAERARDALFVE
jgi:hypothetical protein